MHCPKIHTCACALYFSFFVASCSGGADNAATANSGSNTNAGGGATGTAGPNTGPSGGSTAGVTGSSGVSGSPGLGGAGQAGGPGVASGTGTAGASTGSAGAAGSDAGGTTGQAGGAGSSGSTGTSTWPAGPATAFPGAQGFGKNATGGRGGTVYHVTNLNDTGAGSFRDAVGTANRIIVFDVGGYIQLTTAISAKSNLTIAGQTAPGGGIGLRGGELSVANSSNVIMRYVRIRPGSETASSEDDALSLYQAHNVIIDHSSLEFAPWNNIDGVADAKVTPVEITFQDSLIADPTGQQFGAHTEVVGGHWAWYRNIFSSSHNRNPLAKANTVFVNNVLYNYSAGYTTHTSTPFNHDILNNYFIFGPASTGTDNTWHQVDKNQSIYAAGNMKDSNLNGLLDGAATPPYWYQGTGTVLTSAWSPESNAVPPLDAVSAVRVASSLAGPLPRDEMDALIISQVMTLGKGTTGFGAGTVGPGGGLYTSQTQTGLGNNGYGTITGGTRPTDTDNDGMPDAWEKATGSDPATDDATKKSASGYLLLENYIDWLALPHAISSAGAAVDVDLSAYTAGFANMTPAFTVSGAQSGAVTVSGHSAHFTPSAGFIGVASFNFSVKGSDNSAYTNQVLVLATP